MAPSLLKLVAALCLAPVLRGARTEEASEQQRDLPVTLEPFYGVPKLDVLFSRNVDQAVAFLNKWRNAREFGLYVQRVHTQNQAYFPVRVVLLGICRGNRVLIFDLRPYLHEVPRPLPRPLAEWLEHPNRTFFGMDLKRGAGRMAFEFDSVVRAVDYGVRAWPQLSRSSGVYHMFNRFISSIDLWEPDNFQSLSAQARHTYLQWAVAHYFMIFHGPADEDWVITMTELFEAGPVYLRVAKPMHDWTQARQLWMQRKQERARFSLLDTLKVWRRSAGRPTLGQPVVEQQQPPAAAASAAAASAGTGRPGAHEPRRAA